MPSSPWYSVISFFLYCTSLPQSSVSMRMDPRKRSKSSFFGKAALSMCIAYGLNWLYFDVDNTNLEVHAIRRHLFTSMTYGLVHLPFIMVVSPDMFVNVEGNHLGRGSIGVSCDRTRLSRCEPRRLDGCLPTGFGRPYQ